jgi:hypothetical protein
MDSVPEDVAAVLGSSEDSFTALVIAVGSAACSGSEDSFTAIATQVSLLWLQHRTQAALGAAIGYYAYITATVTSSTASVSS